MKNLIDVKFLEIRDDSDKRSIISREERYK